MHPLFFCAVLVFSFHFLLYSLIRLFPIEAAKLSQKLNLSLSLFTYSCYTTYLNERIRQFGISHRKFLKVWFAVGAYLSVIISILTIFALPLNLYYAISSSMSNFRYSPPTPALNQGHEGDLRQEINRFETGSQIDAPVNKKILKDITAAPPVLQPLIPGINVPLSHFVFIFTALFLSGLWHELGHALAAVVENQSFIGIGVILMFVYPGAYVLFPNKFETLHPENRLKILTAGAWHNFVLCGICTLVLFALPHMCSPVYHYSPSGGVIITEINPSFPLKGYLAPGDVITTLNDCRINGEGVNGWSNCIKTQITQFKRGVAVGYCVSNTALSNYTKNVLDCCSPGRFVQNQCFEEIAAPYLGKQRLQFCASARSVIAQSSGFCYDNLDCKGLNSCYVPKSVNGEHDVLVNVRTHDGRFFLFSGYPAYLYNVFVSSYMLKWDSPYMVLHHIPMFLEQFLQYTISISLALAVLNLAPVYKLDGQLITEALCEYFTIPARYYIVLMQTGTILMIFTLLTMALPFF